MDNETRDAVEESQETESYRGFSKDGKTFRAIRNHEVVDKLQPGVYKAVIDYDSGAIYFIKTESTYDGLVELPSSEFSRIVAEMKNFLTPETKEAFKKYDFIYKRSCLLEGPPGTGKTCIVNRVAEEIVKNGGIVLVNPQPNDCEAIFDVLDSLQPEMTTLVIFEEFESHFRGGRVDGNITSLLDGETQKENVMYLATTNHIEEIPAKIRRPGRFSSVIHVGAPSKEAREFYLKSKLGDEDITKWVESTEGFTIDELKETVLSVKCLGYSIEETVSRIESSRVGPEEARRVVDAPKSPFSSIFGDM